MTILLVIGGLAGLAGALGVVVDSEPSWAQLRSPAGVALAVALAVSGALVVIGAVLSRA